MNDSKKCLIIGATGGIGRALASRLRGGGWQLILAGRKPDALRELADSMGMAASPGPTRSPGRSPICWTPTAVSSLGRSLPSTAVYRA